MPSSEKLDRVRSNSAKEFLTVVSVKVLSEENGDRVVHEVWDNAKLASKRSKQIIADKLAYPSFVNRWKLTPMGLLNRL